MRRDSQIVVWLQRIENGAVKFLGTVETQVVKTRTGLDVDD